MLKAGVHPDVLKDPRFVKARGILEDVEYFDAAFFGFVPKEAAVMDPQARIFHQCVWTALEDAGYDPSLYARRIGLYAGSSPNLNWEILTALHGAGAGVGQYQAALLRDKDFMCTRISYKLNLKGPSVSVQTACSTSLVAVHMAIQGILNGECEIALAGGVTALYPQKVGYMYQEGMILSPDGHCRAFDADSKGVIGGSGSGVVVLKRYEEAAKDRDNIYAIIKGSAINNDGTRKVGYTAPSVEGQAEVIRAAQYMAEIDPDTITYVEAHGTGTELGDPVEVEALKLAFNTEKRGYCGIGSVKTNIGHADTAAGVAGLIKTVLAMKHRLIPPSLHFKAPNPKLGLENSPFYVVSKAMEWKTGGYPMRAGVSSLGIGGTNAHVVLEEAPEGRALAGRKEERGRYWPVILSARAPVALEKMTVNLVSYLKENPGISFPDAAYTLQIGRKEFSYRKMAVCADANDAMEVLSCSGSRKGAAAFCREDSRKPVVFMFPGQGSQYVDMGRELYETEPVFRMEMDRCFEILKPLMNEDIKDILYPAERNLSIGSEKIDQTEITQPVIFVIEYALAKLLMKWGITPSGMIGHSIGEYVAACLAGVFSLEDALSLVAARGKLMQCVPPGAMLSVGLSEEELTPLLTTHPQVSLAAVNSASLCVVSGAVEAISVFGAEMEKSGHKIRPLRTSHAFHSAMMEPVLKEFEAKVKSISLKKPALPYISNLSGAWITEEEAMDPRYWSRHLRRAVQFSKGLEILLKEEDTILIEVGPGRTLGAFANRHKDKKPGQKVVNLIRHPQEKTPDDYFIYNALGELWLYGVKIDWAVFNEGQGRYRVSLPAYPFEKKRYMLDESPIRKISALLSGAAVEDSSDQGENLTVDTASGPELEMNAREFGREYEPPRDEVEANIVKVWQDMLGFDRIGIYDNFFYMNGDSLMATQLISRIKEIYPVEISIKEFFEEPTVARLAEVVKRLLVEKIKELSEDELKKLALG
jgi:phthiocerol/phenolphthiocerol synthesis type-I polyketide synthase E